MVVFDLTLQILHLFGWSKLIGLFYLLSLLPVCNITKILPQGDYEFQWNDPLHFSNSYILC